MLGNLIQKAISYVHDKIHEGRYFTLATLGIINGGAYTDILIRVGENSCHTVFTLLGMQIGRGYLYKLPTYSATGGAITPINNNEFSSFATTTLFYVAPTVTTIGTQMAAIPLPAGQVVSILSRKNTEIILHTNRDYLLRVYNESVTNDYFSIQLGYYHPR